MGHIDNNLVLEQEAYPYGKCLEVAFEEKM